MKQIFAICSVIFLSISIYSQNDVSALKQKITLAAD